MHSIDQKCDSVGISRFLNPVAKVEYVAGRRPSVLQHSIDLTTELPPWRE